jgi:DnaJ-class molecular chaperone
MASVDIPDIDYEYWCGKCHGEGYKIEAGKGKVICDNCGGAGYYTTQEGEKLLTFLEHQGFVPKSKAL